MKVHQQIEFESHVGQLCHPRLMVLSESSDGYQSLAIGRYTTIRQDVELFLFVPSLSRRLASSTARFRRVSARSESQHPKSVASYFTIGGGSASGLPQGTMPIGDGW